MLFQDALETDYDAVAAETGVSRAAANLPYNIATPLIVGWLTAERWLPWFDKLIVMVQREVAERLVAAPGAANTAGLRSWPNIARNREFCSRCRQACSCRLQRWPPLWSRSCPAPLRPDAVPVSLLEQVTAAAFGQRRKMLRSSLASLGVDTAAACACTDRPRPARRTAYGCGIRQACPLSGGTTGAEINLAANACSPCCRSRLWRSALRMA